MVEYTVHCTLYSVHCTVYNVHFAIYLFNHVRYYLNKLFHAKKKYYKILLKESCCEYPVLNIYNDSLYKSKQLLVHSYKQKARWIS